MEMGLFMMVIIISHMQAALKMERNQEKGFKKIIMVHIMVISGMINGKAKEPFYGMMERPMREDLLPVKCKEEEKFIIPQARLWREFGKKDITWR